MLLAALRPLRRRRRELRTAIELAPAQGTKWLFLDTKGDADGAAAAVETAAKQGAVAILGPVGAREVTAAARAAALREHPDRAARSRGRRRSGGRRVPARRLARPTRAARSRSSRSPRASRPSPCSRRATTSAPKPPTRSSPKRSASACKSTGQGTYDPTGGDVEPDVKQFLNLVPATNPRLAEHLAHAKTQKLGWETFSPDIPYSLLYIPDRYDRAAIVAAFLPYFNVELRTTEFPDPDMLRKQARRSHAAGRPARRRRRLAPSDRCRCAAAPRCRARCSSTASPASSAATSAAQFAADFQRERTGRAVVRRRRGVRRRDARRARARSRRPPRDPRARVPRRARARQARRRRVRRRARWTSTASCIAAS